MLQRQKCILTLLLFLAGCAWMPVGAKYIGDGVQAELPQGWLRKGGGFVGLPHNRIAEAKLEGNKLGITRDAPELQSIIIQRIAIDKELDHTKKKFALGMSSQEVAAIELTEVQADPEVTHFELLENSNAVIDGQQGFRLVYIYRTRDGLKLKNVRYGLLLSEWVYRIQYQAPLQYYFERDISTFERLRESIRLVPDDMSGG